MKKDITGMPWLIQVSILEMRLEFMLAVAKEHEELRKIDVCSWLNAFDAELESIQTAIATIYKCLLGEPETAALFKERCSPSDNSTKYFCMDALERLAGIRKKIEKQEQLDKFLSGHSRATDPVAIEMIRKIAEHFSFIQPGDTPMFIGFSKFSAMLICENQAGQEISYKINVFLEELNSGHGRCHARNPVERIGYGEDGYGVYGWSKRDRDVLLDIFNLQCEFNWYRIGGDVAIALESKYEL